MRTLLPFCGLLLLAALMIVLVSAAAMVWLDAQEAGRQPPRRR